MPSWASKDDIEYTTKLHLTGIDQVGLMNEVTRIISNQLSVNIGSINISTKAGVFEGYITVKVFNTIHLDSLIKKLEQVDGIKTIERL